MPTEQSEAIVLRTFPWSETSLVVNLFTRDFGKLAMVAKGAYRPKGPFEAALDLLSVCRIVFIAKSGDALDILTEAKLQKRFRAGSSNLLRLYAGYYVAELLEKMTDRGDAQPEIYELALATLDALACQVLDPRAVVLRFELHMLRLTGHAPSWNRCVRCGGPVSETGWYFFSISGGGGLCPGCQAGARMLVRLPRGAFKVLNTFSNPNWRQIPMENFTLEHRGAIRGVMVKYLNVTLDRKLHLHAFLEELGR